MLVLRIENETPNASRGRSRVLLAQTNGEKGLAYTVGPPTRCAYSPLSSSGALCVHATKIGEAHVSWTDSQPPSKGTVGPGARVGTRVGNETAVTDTDNYNNDTAAFPDTG